MTAQNQPAKLFGLPEIERYRDVFANYAILANRIYSLGKELDTRKSEARKNGGYTALRTIEICLMNEIVLCFSRFFDHHNDSYKKLCVYSLKVHLSKECEVPSPGIAKCYRSIDGLEHVTNVRKRNAIIGTYLLKRLKDPKIHAIIDALKNKRDFHIAHLQDNTGVDLAPIHWNEIETLHGIVVETVQDISSIYFCSTFHFEKWGESKTKDSLHLLLGHGHRAAKSR